MRGQENKRMIKLKKPALWAGGFDAIKSSISYVLKDMDLVNGFKALRKLNQVDGYDCPGCAWPDPDQRSSLGEFCENGAKAVAEEATNFKADPDFFSNNPVAKLRKLNDYEIGKSGRITHPMYLPKGATHYQKIWWDDAFKNIAVSLNRLDSPDQAAFYTSGRTSNEV